ncbi:MAG: DUF3192 domain-containing protein [Parachlamydiales bacterium]|nr:DUF3192 domain-containing protein [Parachlamydiales bacterium]
MKKVFFSLLLLIFSSCSTNSIQSGALAEQNRINILDLRVGMNQEDVLDVMGHPYDKEFRKVGNVQYEVWLYITKATFLGQSQLITRNFTPLVFRDETLKGWGWQYYKFVFNVDNEHEKRKEEVRQKYTNDKEEWPRNEHLQIAPLGKQPTDQPKPEEKPAATEDEDTIDEDIKLLKPAKPKETQPKEEKSPCKKDGEEGYYFWE